MTKNRVEAFSDGVIAIILTIMVLEMKAPAGNQIQDLIPMIPVFLSYVLSFVYIGIYWNNHHHLFHAVKQVSGGVLWANLHLLFWLSLVPFVTAWAGEHHFSEVTVAFYGVALFMAAVAYYILTRVLLAQHETSSPLHVAVSKDFKGMISLVVYGAAILVAWWQPMISCLLYVVVAVMWVIPDRRIERALGAGRAN